MEFGDWKPRIESSVEDLRVEVGALRKTVHRVVLEAPSPTSPGILPTPGAAAAASSAVHQADGPSGHRSPPKNREPVFGSVFTHTHLPVTGMQPSTDPKVPCSSSLLHFGTHTSGGRGSVESELGMFRSRSRVPKVHFPQFVGDNPKLWISRCRDYFDLYGVESTDWIKIASMHFSDAATRWLQSVESRVRSLSWEDFCALVLERFGRDKHALLIRQLFHIKQDGSVSDYIDKFTGLVDQIRAYESTPDPLYFTLRFVDGLRDDLRASVLVQRPSDLDTACLLAQLQEEVLEPVQKELRKPEFFSPTKYLLVASASGTDEHYNSEGAHQSK